MDRTTQLTAPTPKQQFLQSGDNVSAHRQMVDSREFQRAVDVAQREYLGFASSQIVDNNTAMAAGWKVKAVTEFCYMMRMLSEDLTPARPRVISGLDHTQ